MCRCEEKDDDNKQETRGQETINRHHISCISIIVCVGKMKLNTTLSWLSATSVVSIVNAFTFSSSRIIQPTSFASSSSSPRWHSTLFSSSTAMDTTSPNLVGTPQTPFDDGVSPFEITTPIYYVNDKPHIGHAYTSTACDVIARFMRLSGREVFFLSGTDEHGQKVEQSAEKRGMEPQKFVDEVSTSFRDLLELMNISNDKFIRTTSKEHQKAVQVSILRGN